MATQIRIQQTASRLALLLNAVVAERLCSQAAGFLICRLQIEDSSMTDLYKLRSDFLKRLNIINKELTKTKISKLKLNNLQDDLLQINDEYGDEPSLVKYDTYKIYETQAELSKRLGNFDDAFNAMQEACEARGMRTMAAREFVASLPGTYSLTDPISFEQKLSKFIGIIVIAVLFFGGFAAFLYYKDVVIPRKLSGNHALPSCYDPTYQHDTDDSTLSFCKK